MSTEDGPGIRTTVFMKGCPLRCVWCHNPEGISPEHTILYNESKCIKCGTCRNFEGEDRVKNCPAGALVMIGRYCGLDDLVKVIMADSPFYEESGGGVTFSGGECLLQHPFLAEAIPMLKSRGIHVAVDTSGFAPEDVFARIAQLSDLVLFDLKLISDGEHRLYTGQSNGLILRNAVALGKMKVPAWIRIPVIPGMTDSPENIAGIARFVRENMANIERLDLLGYNDLCRADYEKLGVEYPLKDMPRVSRKVMERLKLIAEDSGVGEITISNFEEV
ncbi:MAG: glycyl-radical enzyme activating protein [Bacillota bacterium]